MVDTLTSFYQAHSFLLFLISITSILCFFGTLIVVPFLLRWIPEDFLVRERSIRSFSLKGKSVFRVVTAILRNLVGIILFTGGLVMLLLPGQGIITIFVGAALVDFPGKYKLERKLIMIPGVLNAINGIRRRMKTTELKIPEENKK